MATSLALEEAPAVAPGAGRLVLFGLLGFSAGLPFYMFSTVLALRLSEHGVALAVIGFFAWVQLLPSFKFAWAPLLDRFDVPGFGRFFGKRRGWIMLAQLGIASSTAAMAVTADDMSLGVTALFAVCLAFWTTTLEVAADAWRIELAPTADEQGPLVAANLWGYRSAMVAAGSGALLIADARGWGAAYGLIAAAAFAPFPVLAAMKRGSASSPFVSSEVEIRPMRDGVSTALDTNARKWEHPDRAVALATGLLASVAALLAFAALIAGVGALAFAAAAHAGVDGGANVTPWVLGLCLLPFLAMAALLPRIRRAAPTSRLRSSVVIGPYVDFFWRYGSGALVLMAFVSIYRMGDVLALTLSKPMIRGLGYSLSEMGRADSIVALVASMSGVAIGGWIVTRWRQATTLVIGAVFAAIGNFAFVWLAHQPLSEAMLYVATAADQFGNGLSAVVFVVYLSMLVNPRWPGAQFAFLSGFAFLLPRLLAGAGGTVVERLDRAGYAGFDLFFAGSGVASLAAIAFLPVLARIKPRADDT